MAIFRGFCTLAIALSISACGWQLRGWHSQNSIDALQLVVSDRYAPLTLALQETMQQQRISSEKETPLQLHIGEESVRKRTVAVTSIGSPSQYELSLSVSYQYRIAGEPAATLPVTVSASRTFDFDPNNTVAKNEEEETLLEEMRRELALRILQLAPAPVDYGKTPL